jgi:galactose mutarotase-like enzyme
MSKQNFSINNGFLNVSVNKYGAELCSVLLINNQFEFMWNANPTVWNRHAPILFPIVGKINENIVSINSNKFEMGQHGFARDCDFELISETPNFLTFLLISNTITLEKYPFAFKLFIIYRFTDIKNQLKITYRIENNSSAEMPFSIGAHPGFKLPVADLSQYEINFYLLNKIERHLLKDGLFNNETEIIDLENQKLNLSTKLFDKDAIVLKDCETKKISLKHKLSNYEVSCEFNDFTDFGIWAKKGNEDFVCLEPWLGFADNIGFNGDIFTKKGIVILPANEKFEASYFLNFTN